MTITRIEHLEERVEVLQDRVVSDSRCLKQLASSVDRRLTSKGGGRLTTTTRDSLVSVTLRLHDSCRELDTLRTELRILKKSA